ncbi:MAG TPA: alpha/beta hydrolase, partial [Tepidisphaeraceae bacterium]|nr:alpha/beta hydrolase [Tepidisphaeraceae bacterium]
GHGRTGDVDRPFSFEQSADDTAALLKYLNVEKADFYGYSNGGNIAMQMAIRHPEMVRKLVVMSAMFKSDGLYPDVRESIRNGTPENMPPELREAYLKTAPNPQDLPTFVSKSIRRMMDFKDWAPSVIASIKAPTLIIIGDRDIVRPEHAVEMYRLFPHGQLAIFPASDHMTIINRADLLLKIIPQFLDMPMAKD